MQSVADSLVVSGAVEGVCCEMIVDTGSNITIVRPDVLKRVAKDVAPDLHTVDSWFEAPVISMAWVRIPPLPPMLCQN